jgi:hypothetical protein
VTVETEPTDAERPEESAPAEPRREPEAAAKSDPNESTTAPDTSPYWQNWINRG